MSPSRSAAPTRAHQPASGGPPMCPRPLPLRGTAEAGTASPAAARSPAAPDWGPAPQAAEAAAAEAAAPRRWRRARRLGGLPFVWGFLAFVHAASFAPRRPPYLHYSPASEERSPLSEVKSGLEGVVAFETEIAEPDKEGGALRYRGVDIEDLVGNVPFEKVWGLLVDGRYEPGPPAGRAASARDSLGGLARGPAVGPRDAGARVGDAAAARHPRRPGARGPRARVGHGALVRRPVRPRRGRAACARRPRSTRRGRSPSASWSAGAARRTRATSRRSTPTGSRRPSTA